MSALGRPRLRPVSSSPGTTSVTATGFGRALRISAAQPVAFRLMTALASATSSAAGSVREVRDPIVLAPFYTLTIQNLTQFDAIEIQEPGELPFTQHSLAVCFRSEEIQPKSGRAICVGLISVGRRQVAQYLPCLFVSDFAVCFKPVPCAGLGKAQLFEFDFGLCQIGEELHGLIGSAIAAFQLFPKARFEIDVNRFTPQESVYRSPIKPGQMLQFIDASAALTLFDSHQRGARDLDSVRGIGLFDFRGLPRHQESLSDFDGGQFIERGVHAAAAQRATNEDEPSEFTNPFHSSSCFCSRRFSLLRASSSERPSARPNWNALRLSILEFAADELRSAKWSRCKAPAMA